LSSGSCICNSDSKWEVPKLPFFSSTQLDLGLGLMMCFQNLLKTKKQPFTMDLEFEENVKIQVHVCHNLHLEFYIQSNACFVRS
jgi:hypothetical protein